MKPLVQSSAPSAKAASGSAWHAFGHGLLPLAILAGSIAATLMLTLAARVLTAVVDFGIQQWMVAGVLVTGLLVSLIAYSVALIRTYRRWRDELRRQDDAIAVGTLWALIVTVIVVLMPVAVAALAPQHPAP